MPAITRAALLSGVGLLLSGALQAGLAQALPVQAQAQTLPASAQTTPMQLVPGQTAPTLDDIERTYIDQDAAMHPVGATALGLHGGDARLDDVSAGAHATQIRHLRQTLTDLAALNAAKLTQTQRDDRDVLAAQIGGQLLEEENVQQWRHNPDLYVSLATTGPYVLIARDFAPLAQRMQSVIAREEQIPALFAAARANLSSIPKPWVEIGLEDIHGGTDFLGQDVPKAFASVQDRAAQDRLAKATKQAVAAARAFEAWLKAQPASGNFAYGLASFRKLLDADMIDLTPEQILAAGRAQLAKDEAEFRAASAQVDPASPAHALDVLGKDHPESAQLIGTAAAQLAGLRRFVLAHKIIDLPGDDLPKVTETPEFQRAMIFGAMDPPGPFEHRATQAYYYITPPDASKPQTEQNAYLAYFNRALLLNLSVHETMPGHFVQYLYLRAHPEWSLIRQTAHSYTATEGWAHYDEQMMVEEGLSGHDPKLHLAQLQDALLRDCRLIASVEMHTHGMTLADAATLMSKECFQPREVAYKEARRGTSDPGYFSYTLGKLMIYKLRADAAAAKGKTFSLAKFHDDFESAGLVPLKVIRREILGHDGPLL